MRTEKEIINRIVETTTKMTYLQNDRENRCFPTGCSEKEVENFKKDLISLDNEINTLSIELHTLSWLFGEKD